MEHLVLVVHGIGDALMSVDLGMVQLRSLVECCDTMRAHHEEVRDSKEASVLVFLGVNVHFMTAVSSVEVAP